MIRKTRKSSARRIAYVLFRISNGSVQKTKGRWWSTIYVTTVSPEEMDPKCGGMNRVEQLWDLHPSASSEALMVRSSWRWSSIRREMSVTSPAQGLECSIIVRLPDSLTEPLLVTRWPHNCDCERRVLGLGRQTCVPQLW